MNINDELVSERIKQLRALRNMTQGEFADHLNVSRVHLNLIENGTRKASEKLIERIARIFGVRKEWIMSGIGPMNKSDDSGDTLYEMIVNTDLSDKESEFLKNFLLAGREQRDKIIKIFNIL